MSSGVADLPMTIASCSAEIRHRTKLFCLRQRFDRRPVQYLAFRCELRSMARAVPAAFEGVPMHHTAHMGADGGVADKCAVFPAIGSNFLEALAQDAALARLQ